MMTEAQEKEMEKVLCEYPEFAEGSTKIALRVGYKILMDKVENQLIPALRFYCDQRHFVSSPSGGVYELHFTGKKLSESDKTIHTDVTYFDIGKRAKDALNNWIGAEKNGIELKS